MRLLECNERWLHIRKTLGRSVLMCSFGRGFWSWSLECLQLLCFGLHSGVVKICDWVLFWWNSSKLYLVFSNCCREFSPYDKIKVNAKLSYQNKNEFWVFIGSCFFLHTDSLLFALISVETSLRIWKLLQVSSPLECVFGMCVGRPNFPCPNASHFCPHMTSLFTVAVSL